MAEPGTSLLNQQLKSLFQAPGEQEAEQNIELLPHIGSPQPLPTINQPQELSVPSGSGISNAELTQKLLRNEVLSDEELEQLSGMQDNPVLRGVQGATEVLGVGKTMLEEGSKQVLPFAIATGAELAGTAGGLTLGGPAGATVGAMAGSLAGEYINQTLGLTNPSGATLFIAAFAPGAVDTASHFIRGRGHRLAEITAVGRAHRGKINAEQIIPGAADQFMPEIAREFTNLGPKLARNRQTFKALEDKAFEEVRANGTTVDLGALRPLADQLDPKTIRFLRTQMGKRTSTMQKFNDLIPPPARPGEPTRIGAIEDTDFDGSELVEFRQTLNEARDFAFDRGDVGDLAHGRDIDRMSNLLDDIIKRQASALEAAGDGNSAQLLLRANRVSQYRAAMDQWIDLVAGASSTFPIRERNFVVTGRGKGFKIESKTNIVPEYDMNGINKAILAARTFTDQGLHGGKLDPLIRMIDSTPRGRESWEEFISVITANSPAMNLTILQPGESFMTRSIQGAGRAIGLQLMNEVIVHPVGRRILAKGIEFQGHTTLTRNMLSQIIGVMRTFENLDRPSPEEQQVNNLSNFVVQRLAEQGILPGPEAPGIAIGAAAQIAGQQPVAPAAGPPSLGPENVNVPLPLTAPPANRLQREQQAGQRNAVGAPIIQSTGPRPAVLDPPQPRRRGPSPG